MKDREMVKGRKGRSIPLVDEPNDPDESLPASPLQVALIKPPHITPPGTQVRSNQAPKQPRLSSNQQPIITRDSKTTLASVTPNKEEYHSETLNSTVPVSAQTQTAAEITANPLSQNSNITTPLPNPGNDSNAPVVILTSVLTLIVILGMFISFMKRDWIMDRLKRQISTVKRQTTNVFKGNSLKNDDMLYPDFVLDNDINPHGNNDENRNNSSGSIGSPGSESSDGTVCSMFGIPIMTLPRQELTSPPPPPMKSVPKKMATKSRVNLDGSFTLTRDSTIYLNNL
jgi:hypothetical protein